MAADAAFQSSSRLDIIIAARNLLQQGLESAKHSLKDFFNKTKDTYGGGAANALAAAFAASEKIKGALVAVNVASDIWNGKLENVSESLKKLPFGLGEVVGLLEAAILKTTGWGEELDKLKEREKELADLRRRQEQMARSQASFRDAGRELEDRLAIARARGEEREYLKDRIELERDLARIQQQGKDSGSANEAKRQIAIRRALFMEAQRERREEQDAEIAKAAEKQREEAEKLAEAERAKQERLLEEKRRADDALTSAEAQLAAKRQEALGNELEAQLILIRDSYRRRIDAAQSAAEREAIIQQQAFDEAAARKDAAERGRKDGRPQFASSIGTSALEVSSRFTGIAATQSAEARVASGLQGIAAELREQKNITKEQTKLLASINLELRNGGLATEAV